MLIGYLKKDHKDLITIQFQLKYFIITFHIKTNILINRKY